MREKRMRLYASLQAYVSKKTGFTENKIDLIISKRSDPNIPIINYHEFEYEGKKYILFDDNLSISSL